MEYLRRGIDGGVKLRRRGLRALLLSGGVFALAMSATGFALSGVAESFPSLASRSLYLGIVAGVALAGAVATLAGWMLEGSAQQLRDDIPLMMDERELTSLDERLRRLAPTSPLSRKISIWKKNARCFVAVVRGGGRNPRVVGHFVGYRLTRSAVERLKTGELKGKEIVPEDITPGRSLPDGIYISFMEGRDRMSQGSVLKCLIDDIKGVLQRQETIAVFARVATVDSLRLAKQYNFSAMNSPKLELTCSIYREFRRGDGDLVDRVARGRQRMAP
jgi:hypothetical protein